VALSAPQVGHEVCRTTSVKRLEQRWQRRWQEAPQPAARTVRIQEAVKLRHSPEQVWALIEPAEHSVVLSPESVARAFRVPGTPAGLGQQQCFVDLDGSVVESRDVVCDDLDGERVVRT
jgi:hypothetical protein